MKSGKAVWLPYKKKIGKPKFKYSNVPKKKTKSWKKVLGFNDNY